MFQRKDENLLTVNIIYLLVLSIWVIFTLLLYVFIIFTFSSMILQLCIILLSTWLSWELFPRSPFLVLADQSGIVCVLEGAIKAQSKCTPKWPSAARGSGRQAQSRRWFQLSLPLPLSVYSSPSWQTNPLVNISPRLTTRCFAANSQSLQSVKSQ